MDVGKLASALERGGVKPVDRVRIGRNDVFIADGFVPHIRGKFFEDINIKPSDFPNGCFMTVWWTTHKNGRGGALFCKPDHDPLLEQSFKQRARINSARREATAHIRMSRG